MLYIRSLIDFSNYNHKRPYRSGCWCISNFINVQSFHNISNLIYLRGLLSVKDFSTLYFIFHCFFNLVGNFLYPAASFGFVLLVLVHVSINPLDTLTHLLGFGWWSINKSRVRREGPHKSTRNQNHEGQSTYNNLPSLGICTLHPFSNFSSTISW